MLLLGTRGHIVPFRTGLGGMGKEKAQRLEDSPVQSQHITTELRVSKHRESPIRPPLVLPKPTVQRYPELESACIHWLKLNTPAGPAWLRLAQPQTFRAQRGQAPDPLPCGPPKGHTLSLPQSQTDVHQNLFSKGTLEMVFLAT